MPTSPCGQYWEVGCWENWAAVGGEAAAAPWATLAGGCPRLPTPLCGS